jgi:hypothetical protein
MSVFRVGSNKSSVNNFPSVRPTLDLDFANSKTLDPRITFTRASGGSYMGADGLIKYAGVNEARFDHDPVTGESLGLLVEEARTNLTTYSEDFANAAWSLFGTASRSANTVTAPDGNMTADTVTLPISSGIYQFISASASTTYTFSVWIRTPSTSQNVNIVLNTNLGDATQLTVTATTTWQRFSVTKTTIVGTTTLTSQLSTGGGNTFYVWGAQTEQGSFPTSYIPTVASTRTRSADNASITGKNFREWYRQDEGSVYADTKINGVQTTRYDRLWSITNANLNIEGISLSVSGPGGNFYVMEISVTNSATGQVDGTLPETAFTAPRLKSVFALKQNNCAGASNGQQRFVDSIVDLSLFTTPVDRLLIGQPQRFQGTSCMTISRLSYYPKRLPDAQLQALTK